jgi:uncharacterized membrane protein
MRGWWTWIAATLVVAVVVHVASVMVLPRLIMMRTMGGISKVAGLNHMTFGKRPTSANRGVVRPSPDLLYGSCVYDLHVAGGAVRVRASGMPKTYWSVSAFDADTNNFFVENDRKAGDHVDFLIVSPGYAGGGTLPKVEAPTEHGIVLFRTLIDDDKRLAAIDAARRHASCEAYRAE